ncbi:MAG: class I SAM-dependent methyltransferase [Nitrospirae bacterium]|nr:MAG: class I SAM-dependent methyltransferase [Nitrospirota bacterium]
MAVPFLENIKNIMACPRCKAALLLNESRDAECAHCHEVYRWMSYTWDLVPSCWNTSSTAWLAWEHLQANGLESYRHDPQHNLAVGPREDCLQFSRFCKFDGLVLDVGCGPQAWPTYFAHHAEGTRFVGVDPLAGGIPADYAQFRALGEFLPFADRVFDHVAFATSLDHFIDPLPVLREACRVCRPSGFVDIWVGDKSSGAAPRKVSHPWYDKLQKPNGAEDVFHLKRLGSTELRRILGRLDVQLVDDARCRVNDHSTNYFCKLQVPV